MDRGSRVLRYHQIIERRTLTETVLVGAASALLYPLSLVIQYPGTESRGTNA